MVVLTLLNYYQCKANVTKLKQLYFYDTTAWLPYLNISKQISLHSIALKCTHFVLAGKEKLRFKSKLNFLKIHSFSALFDAVKVELAFNNKLQIYCKYL